MGLASVTFGTWIARYRPVFVVITMTLLGMAFYKTYIGRGNASPLAKAILWVTAIISISLTVYSILNNV